MTIRENNTLRTDIPPFEVLDENEVVLRYFMTYQECQEFINNL
jgi:hypothetical protein